MEDLGSLLLALLIIYSFLIIFTLLLISKFYKSYFVCGIKTKEIYRSVHYTRNGHYTSYFSFKTKDGKKINRGTSLFPMTKKGKKKYFLYNDDKNKIIAKIYTILWQTFIFGISILYSMLVGIPFFIIALFLVIITIWLYSKYYKKKYVKVDK